MCGIAGVSIREGTPNDNLLKTFGRLLEHRGPDGRGRVIEGKVGLVHTRLSVIDLKNGSQPLSNVRGDKLVANAEIYNHIEIKQQFHKDAFFTNSDCETPLLLYEKKGIDFAEDLRGMYAISILSADTGDVLLSRDPFGIKPLYIHEAGGKVFFSSEIKTLIDSGIVKPVLNTKARDQLLSQQYTEGSLTAIKNICRVLPGETIRIANGEILERFRLSTLPAGPPQTCSEEDGLRLLDKALMESVEMHQRSDVPYGLFLSGGIDSSSILACMRELNDQPVQTFSAGFSGTNVKDERLQAEILAKKVGAHFHSVDFGERDFWSLLPQVVSCLDDPTVDYATLPTFKLGALASEFGLKVILSGEGGDELFAGYGRYRRLMRPWLLGGRPMRKQNLFDRTNIFKEKVPILPIQFDLETNKNLTKLQQAQAYDCSGWLPNDLLIKLDRCLMAHGIEGRVPFLDPAVANVAMNFPDNLKIKSGYGKYILRKWLQRKLPEAKPFSRKKGFTVPVGEWISKKGKIVGELVASQPCIYEVADKNAVISLFSNLGELPSSRSSRMAWTLLFYALWYGHHIERRSMEGDVFDILSIT